MTWNLFIDDERNLEDVTWAPWQVRERYRNEEWVIARNHFETLISVHERGMPSFISFDHDLGEGLWSGHDIAKELVDIDINTIEQFYKIPYNFNFYVHSKNPIGKNNIESYLNNYMRFRNGQ